MGYLTTFLKRIPRVDDQELIAYLRRRQLSRLVGGADNLEMIGNFVNEGRFIDAKR